MGVRFGLSKSENDKFTSENTALRGIFGPRRGDMTGAGQTLDSGSSIISNLL
jgi:hypothetical protein